LFNWQWTYQHTGTAASQAQGSEIVSFDSLTRRLWVVGTDANIANPVGRSGIDVLDLSGTLVNSINLQSVGGVNSVAIANGRAAVAITAPVKTNPGVVQFYNTSTLGNLGNVTVGANPDAVSFTPDGSKLLVANEGEPINYTGAPDPVGSVSIIDASTLVATTAGFASFDSQAAALRAAGVRLLDPTKLTTVGYTPPTVAQDLEPEYIAVSKDGTTAAVTLQEANAVAFIDIATSTVASIKALGLKDHSLPGNGLDVADRDGTGTAILNGQIQNWNVKGIYMPDGIASFTQGGQQFYVTANEGDSRADWSGYRDEVRVGSAAIDATLNTALSAAHGTDWKSNDDKLNRLTVSWSGDTDGDGDLDQLQAYGARSFSILDANGNMVFDSGDQLEQIIKAQFMPSATCTLATPGCLWDDTRSDNKGPEPESAVIGQVGNDTLLFLGLERSNAIMVWNLNNVNAPSFVEMLYATGNVGPEGLSFFVDGDYGYLAVSSEVSGSTALYRTAAPVPVPAAVWLLGSALGALGVARRRGASFKV
jgi:3-phytase